MDPSNESLSLTLTDVPSICVKYMYICFCYFFLYIFCFPELHLKRCLKLFYILTKKKVQILGFPKSLEFFLRRLAKEYA